MQHFALKVRRTKIKKESERIIRGLKIRTKLRQMDRNQTLIRLELDNCRACDDEIETVLSYQLRAVPDLDLPLALDGEPAGSQFGKKSAAIDAFKESGPERFMHTRRGIHYLAEKRGAVHRQGICTPGRIDEDGNLMKRRSRQK
jgi:hypothetical protein